MSIQVISFNCVLKNKVGHVISSTFNRDVLNATDGPGGALSGLAKGLQDLKEGEHRSISLSAEEAYGLYRPEKVILYPKRMLPSSSRVGEIILITDKSGISRPYKVIQFYGDMVSLDGNHPLAGQDLVFEVEALKVRDATPEEIEDSKNIMTNQVLH